MLASLLYTSMEECTDNDCTLCLPVCRAGAIPSCLFSVFPSDAFSFRRRVSSGHASDTYLASSLLTARAVPSLCLWVFLHVHPAGHYSVYHQRPPTLMSLGCQQSRTTFESIRVT